jgi:hypothetical protein
MLRNYNKKTLLSSQIYTLLEKAEVSKAQVSKAQVSKAELRSYWMCFIYLTSGTEGVYLSVPATAHLNVSIF